MSEECPWCGKYSSLPGADWEVKMCDTCGKEYVTVYFLGDTNIRYPHNCADYPRIEEVMCAKCGNLIGDDTDLVNARIEVLLGMKNHLAETIARALEKAIGDHATAAKEVDTADNTGKPRTR